MAVTPTKRDVPNETVPKLDDLKRRFAILGATDDEIEAMAKAWDEDADDPYSDEEKRALIAASDGTIVAMIADVRGEHEFHTTTEEEAEARAANEAFVAAVDAERAEAANVVNGNVDDVLAWVGDDEARASAAIDAERDLRGLDGERKTLVEPLLAILNGD